VTAKSNLMVLLRPPLAFEMFPFKR
jgi:hypothetical protein